MGLMESGEDKSCDVCGNQGPSFEGVCEAHIILHLGRECPSSTGCRIIVGNFQEFNPGWMSSRTAKGIPKDTQREPKSTPREPKGAQSWAKEAKGTKASSQTNCP